MQQKKKKKKKKDLYQKQRKRILSNKEKKIPMMLMFQRVEVQYLQNIGLKADYCTTLCYIYILTLIGLISREK